MVYFCSSISFCKSFDHPTDMAIPFSSTDPSSNNRHQFHRNRKQINASNPLKNHQPCDRSRTAAVDVVILIAVIGASGFLVFPYLQLFCHGIVEIMGATLSVVKYEVCRAPMVYASLGLGIFFAILGAWGISRCAGKKCCNPNCRGLRKAAEFDIQIETEECVKNSTSSLVKDRSSSSSSRSSKGLFELAQDHHRELESELRKMAPPNGRAVLVFRARCGCSVGRMEVLGPKKLRKIKK
ncbi:PREDICTED: uncharacterized protein At5g19025 [Nelumbo nucifera]|uniref:Uncharacterized protein At5g19025 n=1 Tax=Nelumbo nucifera TaxID=4432 RepID=A0A1U8Q5V3_NELNU|nr:PREDICTED: uncharacterized protein At5g19025 [Nelumbo nucifera]